MPKISVIVPVYNVEPYLRRCVDSILAQTYTDFELILVDDGSPDRCPAICDEYAEKDSRVKVIHKENGGLSSARNAGLDVATGKYIYFVDSDDWVDENLLATVVPHMNNGYDMVVFQYRLINEAGILYYDSAQQIIDEAILSEQKIDFIYNVLLSYKIGWEACFRVYRRDIIEKQKLRFADNRVIYAEDLYFCTAYFAFMSKIKVLDDKLYYYFRHTDSITGQDIHKDNLGRICILGRVLYNYWNKNSDCEYLIGKFPLIYYGILYFEIQHVRNDRHLNDKQVKKYIYANIPKDEYDFFCSNFKRLRELLNTMPHEKWDYSFYHRKIEVDYWNDNLPYFWYQIYGYSFRIARKLYRKFRILKKE